VLLLRVEAPLELVGFVVGADHGEEVRPAHRATVGEVVLVVALRVDLMRLRSLRSGERIDLHVVLAEVELPAVEPGLQHVVLLAMPPRARARVEEVDGGALALPPVVRVAVLDEVIARLAFGEVRRRAGVDVAAAVLEVEGQLVHERRDPHHDAHAASVHVADEAREVSVARRVRDERVVLRLPRAIEHDGSDGDATALEAVDVRIGVGAIGDVLADPRLERPARRVARSGGERGRLGIEIGAHARIGRLHGWRVASSVAASRKRGGKDREEREAEEEARAFQARRY
jgi:hypothetical protein